MNVKTHILGGLTGTCLYYLTINSTADLHKPANLICLSVITATSVLGAKLPDIDNRHSSITSHNKVISFLLRIFTEHRGITHTPFILVMFSFILSPLILLNNIYINSAIIGFFIGYISHLMYDLLNPKGIPLLFPATKKHFHIFLIKTDSLGEVIFRLLNFIVLVVLISNILRIHEPALYENVVKYIRIT